MRRRRWTRLLCRVASRNAAWRRRNSSSASLGSERSGRAGIGDERLIDPLPMNRDQPSGTARDRPLPIKAATNPSSAGETPSKARTATFLPFSGGAGMFADIEKKEKEQREREQEMPEGMRLPPGIRTAEGAIVPAKIP